MRKETRGSRGAARKRERLAAADATGVCSGAAGPRRAASKSSAAAAPVSGAVASRGRGRKVSTEDGPGERGSAATPAAAGKDFSKMRLHEGLTRQLEYLGFAKCTPIQALAIPAAVKNDGKLDLLLRAPTGQGKTLAFLIPVLHHMLSRGCKRSDGLVVMVLSPTKELALQTLKVSSDLLRMSPHIVCGAIAGGEKPKSEKARLRKGINVLMATPGRLAYHLEHTAGMETQNLRSFVLDEADRLLDMGFEIQVRSIYRRLRDEQGIDGVVAPKPRKIPVQTLLVSATLGSGVRRLAEFCLRKGAFWADPDGEEAAEGTEAAEFIVPKSLTQWYCEVPAKERMPTLIAALLSRASTGRRTDTKGSKAICFFSSCASVDYHSDVFTDSRWPARGGGAKREREAPAKKVKTMGGGFVGFKGENEEDEDDGDEDEGDEEAEDEERNEDEDKETGTVAGRGNAGTGEKIFTNTPLFKLHGNLTKEERAGHIADFTRAAGGALLASDAAARGLDFPSIDWIVQYDPPQRVEEYLHRVGRTARIGRAGNAVIFLQPSELGFLDLLRDKGVADIRKLDARQLINSLLNHGAPRELSYARDIPLLMMAVLKRQVEDQSALLRLARSAFLSSLKAYRAFPRELREVFDSNALHLGHFATSFALRETPAEISRREFRASEAEGGGKGKARGKGKRKGAGRGGGGKGGAAAAPDERAAKRPRVGSRVERGGRRLVTGGEFAP